jgi:hypothetical protein
MFRWLAVPIVFALCLVLASDGVSGEKKKKKKQAGLSGAVVSIEPARDKDKQEIKDTYTLVLKTPEKKNKKTGAVTREAKEHKIEVTRGTKVEKAAKKKQPAEPATVADIQPGQNVTVFLAKDREGVAERILIAAKKKKKAP